MQNHVNRVEEFLKDVKLNYFSFIKLSQARQARFGYVVQYKMHVK